MTSQSSDLYRCKHSGAEISRAVHLARLEAGDARTASSSAVDHMRSACIRTAEGIRAPWLNVLTAQTVSDVISQFMRISATERSGNPVLLAGDERSMTPDLLRAALGALARSGRSHRYAHVTSAEMLRRLLFESKASAGIFITGANSPLGWSGMDLIGPAGRPAESTMLDRIVAQVLQSNSKPAGRASRNAGMRLSPLPPPTDPVRTADPRDAQIMQRVVLASASPEVSRRLGQLARARSHNWTRMPLAVRQRSLSDPQDADIREVSSLVVQTRSHVGLLIDEAGTGVAVIDETGRLVDPLATLMLIASFDEHASPVRVASGRAITIRPLGDVPVTMLQGGASAIHDRLVESRSGCAIDESDRIWFFRQSPTCDAIELVHRLLAVLRFVRQPLTELIAELPRRDQPSRSTISSTPEFAPST